MRDEVAEVVRGILGDLPPVGSRPPDGVDRAAWDRLAEGGFTLLPLPERLGGSDGELADAAAVVHEIAYACVAVPVAEASFLGAPLLAAAGVPAPPGPFTVAACAGVAMSGDRLSGTVTAVPWLRWVDTALFVVGEAPRHYLATVRLAYPSTTVVPHDNLAGEPRDTLVMDGTPATVVPLPAGDWSAVVEERGALARAVQMAGAAARVRDRTVAYAGVRHQFGRPIAAFQAVQHRLVEMAAETVVMRSAVDAAVDAVDTGRGDARFLVAVAKAETSAGAGLVASAGHQLHGAIGFTLEHDLGAATKRLWSWRDEYGAENHWREVVTDVLAARDEGLWTLLTKGVV
jgi:acyl-CoA dehydrogenase